MSFLGSYEDNEMGRYLARMGGIEMHTNIMLEHQNERSLQNPRLRWEYNIKINLKRLGGCELNMFGSEWEPMTRFCECDNEPSGNSVKSEQLLA